MAEGTLSDRLDSWKEIAAYMRRDVKTVQRWEKREAMPVHRHLHDKMGSVYAFKNELDQWSRNRTASPPPKALAEKLPRWPWVVAGAGVVIALAVGATLLWRSTDAGNPLADARFLALTDFNGIEQAAAISPDGKLVAFQSDRDGQVDVWVTEVGSGKFQNLSRGSARDIVNPSVRTLGFSPDASLVTFWARRLDAAQQSDISVWGLPIVGGSPRVYMDGVAEYDWSADGSHVVYHTPGPGDPTFVRDAGDGTKPSAVFSAPTGLHSHFPLWSRNREFIYFVQGTVPDHMDVGRVKAAGGAPERVTNHDAV